MLRETIFENIQSEFKNIFSKKHLIDDLLAGIIVASVAIPLSLAIALASGVDPAIGLITAIVGGIVCALFGSSELAVSGPAAAMAVLVSVAVEKFGLSGIVFISFGCGILQILTGFLRLGNYIKFVPVPVVMGFTAGIGAIIFLGQLPRIIGLPPASDSNIIATLSHLWLSLSSAKIIPFLLATFTLFLAYVLPKISKKLPSVLIAVIVPSIIAYGVNLPVEKIGQIPNSLPFPKFPSIPIGNFSLFDIFNMTLLIFMLATLETLLCTGALDQILKKKPHDPNRELVGQGLGNLFSSFFSGIPVTAVIVRSALNIQAGAKTKRASIFHSITLLLVVFLFAETISQIPLAVLSGLLISVAIRMFQPAEFLSLWKTEKSDAYVYLTTFFMILFLDFLAGIQVGIIASLIFTAWKISKLHIHFYPSIDGPAQIEFSGNFGFFSSSQIENIQKTIETQSFQFGIIFDLTKVKNLDHSGSRHLCSFVESLVAKNIKIAIHLSNKNHEEIIKLTNPQLSCLFANNELEMEKVLGIENLHEYLIRNRLIKGIEKFQQNLNPDQKKQFDLLSLGQTPHTLFITCSDSRIDPNLITSSKPGELFIVRNVGNIIPINQNDETPAEGAAIEFAVGVLHVKQIIICGHSGCGAIDHVLKGKVEDYTVQKQFPFITKWLHPINDLKKRYANLTLEEAVKINASNQLENLRSYEIVQDALSKKKLEIKVFYYDIANSNIEVFDEVTGRYVSLQTAPPIFGTNQLKGFKLDENQ